MSREKEVNWILRVLYNSRTGVDPSWLSNHREEMDPPFTLQLKIFYFMFATQQRVDGFTVQYAGEFHGQRRTDPPTVQYLRYSGKVYRLDSPFKLNLQY